MVDGGFTSYDVLNDKLFQRNIDRALKGLSDLRTPFKLIANDFYKSEEAIFKLKGPGKYPDFKNKRSKKQKEREVGFAYPLLKRSGALMDSVTSPTATGSFLNIQKTFLQIGTTITNDDGFPYPIVHQKGWKHQKEPRKFLFVGPESKKYASSDIAGRTARWINILASYYNKKMQVLGKANRMGTITP